MKIAYFLDLPYGLGGAGSLLLKQAELMKDIHSVEVVIPCNDEGIPNKEYILRCERKGLAYRTLPYTSTFNFYSVDLFHSLSYVDDICNYLKDNSIEFIHSTQLNIALEYSSRTLGIPHLMNIYQLRDDEFRIYYGDFYPHFHLCDSIRYSKKWEEYLPITSKCLRPISPTDNFYRKNNKNKNQLKILVLGRVCPRKNQLAAIQIIEKLKEKYNIKLTIAGELVEEYAKECQNYVIQNSLQEYVKFEDFVSDVIPILDEHDIFLCSSKDESFPSSIVEALSRDMTIVTTPAGGICEVFNSSNSFVSKGFTTDEILKALVSCLESYIDGNIDIIHKVAYETWEKYFSKKAIRSELNSYYNEICLSKDIRRNHDELILKSLMTYERLIRNNNKLNIYKSRILYIMKVLYDIKCEKAYIWGAGTYGKYAFEIISTIRKDIEVVAYIDRKKEGKINDIDIISPDHINPNNADTVFVAYKGYVDDTIALLESMGYLLNETIWKVN